jgi:hypothetical protein
MAGLSYTTFDVAPLNLTLSNGTISALVNVTNTGALPSKQVVGVFFSKPLSSFVRNHLSLLAIVVQVSAMLWYTSSSIPGGTAMMGRLSSWCLGGLGSSLTSYLPVAT